MRPRVDGFGQTFGQSFGAVSRCRLARTWKDEHGTSGSEWVVERGGNLPRPLPSNQTPIGTYGRTSSSFAAVHACTENE